MTAWPLKSSSDSVLNKATGWSMTWGIVMFVCGILAISVPPAFSVGIATLLAWLLLIAGIAHLIFAFHSDRAGFLWKVLLAVLYGIAAIYLLANPLLGLVTLILLLAVLLFFEGIIEIALYFNIRRFRHSGWLLLDGIVTLILGILICRQWPPISPEVIGTLVGISLMFSGIARFMLSLAVRELNPPQS
jgi:uncharacterized membrane protein HdeD (DUF308 family)